MKNLKLTTICLGLVLALAATTVVEAQAGVFGKNKKKDRTEKTEDDMTPRRFDKYPSMNFMGGTLTRDAHSGWKLGDTPLFLGADCVISMEDSDEGILEEGREAVVMGSMIGGSISAVSILVMKPTYQNMGMSQSRELKKAGPNPNVGQIMKPVE